VQNIRDELAETLGTSQWMDAQSRDSALKKAENMLVLLGFPDFVDDPDLLDVFYQNLRVCQWDNYGNARNIRAFKQAYQFSQLGKPERNLYVAVPPPGNHFTKSVSAGACRLSTQTRTTTDPTTKSVLVQFVSGTISTNYQLQ
jgi:predicted metalloendopeptidase